ncbi:MAG: hypothetical protein M1376_17030 [Planctomycetes bacterium]|nr:hypothetical protein [Planctomycetota bacterium]
MRTRKLTPYCLAALLAGCVPIVSLHPLCTKETIAYEEKLLGTWVEDANQPEVTWEFAHLEQSAARLLPADLRDALDKCYRLNLADKEGRRGSFAACLVKLQDKLFLDVLPDRFPSGEQDPNQMKLVYNAFFFTPVHSFVRVSSIGDQLKIRLTDDDGFKKLVQADPKVVKHDVLDDRPILTASTEELQAFVAKYADDERLFPGEVTLTRRSK